MKTALETMDAALRLAHSFLKHSADAIHENEHFTLLLNASDSRDFERRLQLHDLLFAIKQDNADMKQTKRRDFSMESMHKKRNCDVLDGI